MRCEVALALWIAGAIGVEVVRSLAGVPSPVRKALLGKLRRLPDLPEGAHCSVLPSAMAMKSAQEEETEDCWPLASSFLLRLLLARGLALWTPAFPSLPAHRHYLQLQPELRTMVRHMILSLPPTGLYERDLELFRAFCRHMVEVFKGAPRSVLLENCNKSLLKECEASKEKMSALTELLSLMGVTEPSWSTSNVGVAVTSKAGEEAAESDSTELVLSFLDMVKKKERLEPGRLHARWLQITEKSKKNALLDPSVRASIREGLLRKAEKNGVEVTEREIEEKLRKLRQSAEEKCATMVETAAHLWREVERDEEYLRYRRVEELWQFLGCDALEREFHALDKQVGEERRSRGSSFENWAPIFFGMVLDRLRGGAARGEIDEVYREFSYRRGALWMNRQLKKAVGEIDLLVLGQHRKSGLWEVVAVVEMKSMFYEISLAFCKQHSCKLTDPRNHYIRWLPDASAAARPVEALAEDYEINRSPELFVASLVPDHPYLVGAAKLVMEDVMDTFQFNGGCEAVLQDDQATLALMEMVVEKRGLSISPLDMVDKHHHHLLLVA